MWEGGRSLVGWAEWVPSLLPECELVHAPVYISGLLLLGLRVADGQAHAADGGVADPVQSPPHRNGAGCHVGDLKALDGAGSWG